MFFIEKRLFRFFKSTGWKQAARFIVWYHNSICWVFTTKNIIWLLYELHLIPVHHITLRASHRLHWSRNWDRIYQENIRGNSFLCCYWYQLLAVWNPQGKMYPQGLMLYYYTQHTGTLVTLSFFHTHRVVFEYQLAFYIKQAASWGCLYLIILVCHSVWLYVWLFNLPCDIFCMKWFSEGDLQIKQHPCG